MSEPICKGCNEPHGMSSQILCDRCFDRAQKGLCVRCGEELFDMMGEYLEHAGERFGNFCGPCFEQLELARHQVWMEERL